MYWIGHYILLFFSHFDILILFVFIICVVVVNNSLTILLTPPHTHEKKAMEGSISRERLRDEVVAPYKQNWIGFFSMGIVILATIVTKFPEVIENPVITIPDL